jgi:hypothetical protein
MFCRSDTLFYSADTLFISEKRLVKMLARCIKGYREGLKAFRRASDSIRGCQKWQIRSPKAVRRSTGTLLRGVAALNPPQFQEKRRIVCERKGGAGLFRTDLVHSKVPDRLYGSLEDSLLETVKLGRSFRFRNLADAYDVRS